MFRTILKAACIAAICAVSVIPPVGVRADAAPGAAAAVLIETGANTVIYEKNAHKRLPMASTTKIMTALCAIENADPNMTVTVDDRAVGVEGSSIYLAHGEKMTLRELIYGLMLHSGNDAAVAIACAVSGGTEDFAKLMNETAARIGAADTHFENPNGLDSEEHYTTAYDLAVITSYALKNREFAKVVSTYEINISGGDRGYDRKLKNHNKLLRLYDGCTGVKTGFTKRCGRCLVSSAKRGGTELVAVTLNDGNDWQDHAAMLDYGFDNTESVCLLRKGDYLQTVTMRGGETDSCSAVCAEDLYITRVKGDTAKPEIVYDISPTVDAPVEYGDVLGKVSVSLGGKPGRSTEAVAAESVPQKPKSRVMDNMTVLFKFWVWSMH